MKKIFVLSFLIVMVASLLLMVHNAKNLERTLPLIIEDGPVAQQLADDIRDMGYFDNMTLYVNSYGGSVHAGFEIINAIKTTKGDVKVVIDGAAYSMAGLIAISAEELEADPYALVLIHVARDSNGVIPTDDPVANYFDNEIYRMCKPLLNDKELKHVFVDHKDLVFTGATLVHRKKFGPDPNADPNKEALCTMNELIKMRKVQGVTTGG